MSLASETLARRMHMPRAKTHDVVCERDLRVPMDDGATLLGTATLAFFVLRRMKVPVPREVPPEVAAQPRVLPALKP